jgi:hypothetical protein
MSPGLSFGAVACVLLFSGALGGGIAPKPAPPAAAATPAAGATDADSWVVGTVFNRADGKIVSAVTLTLYFQEIERTPRAPVRGRSNAEGKFVLGPVTSGTYCLSASSFGYHAVAREFTLHRGRRDTVNLMLDRKSAKVSMQRCLPDRASIDTCPVNADSLLRETQRNQCSGQR